MWNILVPPHCSWLLPWHGPHHWACCGESARDLRCEIYKDMQGAIKELIYIWYRQLRAGTLEGDSRTPTVLQSFSQGGALGINLMMLEPWQLVLGGFWNHIMGNQENDPRTPSFWSLSVIKKQSQQLHLSKTRNLTNSIIRLLPLLPC